ncbi:hypothetical protein ACROYT_G041354 [Oculina patagonica]
MLKMRLILAVCFSANLLALIVTGTHIPTSAPNTCDSMMKCTAIKMLEKKLEDLIALVNKTSNCTCTPKPTPPDPFTAGPTTAGPVSSCKEQYDKNKSSKSQVFTLMFGSQKIPVYCHMGNFGCGDGGWTLGMKINGNKKTFHYDSKLWSNNNTYNLAQGKTGFDTNETKLPTYWNTPFTKICLGMKIGQQINFIVVNKRHNSKARIGIIGNQENDCKTTDSRIGFGTGGFDDDSNTCGNQATHSPDNGDKRIKAMGYILVQ